MKRIYREELYEDINSVSSAGRTFILLVILSALVAAIGLLRANVAIIIGVMVAVALLPPLMVFGILVGDGQFHTSLNALILLTTNVVCVNISGVAMFLFQGVRPNSWWEAKKAKKQTRIAISVWMASLAMLSILIHLGFG